MTAAEAIRQAIDEARARFTYIPDGPDDRWKTRAEMERDGGGDCEDFAAWAICRVADDLCPDAPLRMIIGDAGWTVQAGDVRLMKSARHAWCGLVAPDGSESWFDPTPSWPTMVAPPDQWSARTPMWGRDYADGVFGMRWQYV